MRVHAPALLPAAILCVLEGIAALVFGVVQLAAVRMSRPEVGIGTVVTMAVYGAALVAAARGLLRQRRWARALVVMAQLLHLPLAYGFAQGETAWLGVSLGLVSVAVLVCVFLPGSVRAFADPNGPAGQH